VRFLWDFAQQGSTIYLWLSLLLQRLLVPTACSALSRAFLVGILLGNAERELFTLANNLAVFKVSI
jgi:hypothetical protein|tara:strand:+ start:440 stop:637 length:198 start_codon:yes stop_codon:yes gene_type:complete